MTQTRQPADRPALFGAAAFAGTFLFIPVWDVFALIYTVLTGWRSRADAQRGEEARSIAIQPVRRLLILALACLLAYIGVSGLRGIIPQPGPFGFLVTGLNNLESLRVCGETCETSRVIQPGAPVSQIVANSLGSSLWLLGSASVIGAVLTAALIAGALLIERLAARLGEIVWMGGGILKLGVFRYLAAPAFGFGLVWLTYLLILPPDQRLLPPGLEASLVPEGSVILDRVWHMILPGTALALLPSLLAAQSAVRAWTAWRAGGGPGYSRLAVLGLEAARAFYDQAGWLIGGLAVIESLFFLRGIGRLTVDALLRQDGPVVVGMLITFPILLVAARARGAILAGAQRAYAFNHSPAAAPRTQAAKAGKGKASKQARAALPVWQPPRALGQIALAVAGALMLFVLFNIVWGLVASPYDPNQSFEGQTYAVPDSAHPLGYDEQGRDVQSRTLEAHRVSFGLALAAGLIGLVFGGVWGGAASAVRRWRGWLGELLADLIRFPADVAMVGHAGLIAMIFAVSRGLPAAATGAVQSLGSMSAAIGFLLAARLAWAVESVWDCAPAGRSLRWRLAGAAAIIFTITAFTAFQYGEALNFLTLGVLAPLSSLGGNIHDFVTIVAGSGSVADTRFYVLARNLAVPLGMQAFAWFMLQDALADIIGWRRRDYLGKMFS